MANQRTVETGDSRHLLDTESDVVRYDHDGGVAVDVFQKS